MRFRKTVYQRLSPFIEFVGLAAATAIGWRMAHFLGQQNGNEFPTIAVLLGVLIALILHYYIHLLGHLLFAGISNHRVLFIRWFQHTLVKEGRRYELRQTPHENELCNLIVDMKEDKSSIPGLYLLGGGLMNLILSLVCYLLLLIFQIQTQSLMGILFFGLFFSGLWIAAGSLIPMYRSLIPNDGMKLFLLIRRDLEKKAYLRNLFLISELSSSGEREVPLHPEDIDLLFTILDQEQEKPEKQLGIFIASFLMRLYDRLIWHEEYEVADRVLAVLFDHRYELPESWQALIKAESIYCLSLQGSLEQNDLTDRMVTADYQKTLENGKNAVMLRSLYAWSLHHYEMKEESAAFAKMASMSLLETPFEYARIAWDRQLASIPTYD